MYKGLILCVFFLGISYGVSTAQKTPQLSPLKVLANGRFLATKDNKPFFWLGDTGWLLFTKLTREEVETYLETRRKQGFNVIQVMVLHTLTAQNVYGDSALINQNVATPRLTKGSSFAKAEEYDFWDHVDFVVDRAAQKGIYMALVPIWGTNVRSGHVSRQEAKTYAEFITNRYKKRANIVWLNGGDIKGSDSLETWKIIGRTINQLDTDHLITFHPRGRASSTEWFHNEDWLDFNMVQSGHRTYAQDTSATDKTHYGEDNWRYMQADLALTPTKPTLDAEPSYEAIPYGLHDFGQPRWNAADIRRYAYWSVLAGGFGFTYGHNAVMQMHNSTTVIGDFGANELWSTAINAEGASNMIHLKTLMLSKPSFDRVFDPALVADQASGTTIW